MIKKLYPFSRPTAVERELRTLLGRECYKSACKKSLTLSQRMREAAELLRIDLDTLCERLAHSISVVFVRSAPSIDAATLPRRFGLRELRRLSVLPLMVEGEVRTIFGLDRDRLLREMPDLARCHFLMISPDTLARALDLLESQLINRVDMSVYNKTITQKVFERLHDYASDSSADSILLVHRPDGILYRLIRASESISEGLIAASATEIVLEFCAEMAAKEVTFSVSKSGKAFRCFYDRRTNEYLLTCKMKEEQAVSSSEDPAECASDAIELTTDTTCPILVVDDNADFLKVLIRFLVREGFVVSSAQSAVEAFAHISTAAVLPRAIVCDLHMPSMNGLDFVGKLKRDKKLFDIPTFFLTSDDSIESELATIRSGAEACISKGHDPRVLIAHLRRVCSREAA